MSTQHSNKIDNFARIPAHPSFSVLNLHIKISFIWPHDSSACITQTQNSEKLYLLRHTLIYLSPHLESTVSLNRFSLPAVFRTIKRCNLAASSVYSVSLISFTLAQLAVGVVGLSKEGRSRTVLATWYE